MILLASAKTMKESNTDNCSIPVFNKESLIIRQSISKLSKDELASYFKISSKILDTTYNYYHKEYCGRVIDSLDGQVFKQITSTNIDYIKDNVYVLDALYGILNGNDKISLFRLDFNTTSLLEQTYYKYWFDKVNNFIKQSKHKQVLILSSDEYTKLLDLNHLNKEIYTLTFDSSIKSSVHKKQIRGLIANYCITNKIKDYKKLNNVNINEYKLSCKDNIINVKRLLSSLFYLL